MFYDFKTDEVKKDLKTAEELLNDILTVRMFGEANHTPTWSELDARIENFIHRR